MKNLVILLDLLLEGMPISEGIDMAPDYAEYREKALSIEKLHDELKEFALSLASGDINANPPARHNYLAAPLKQLQAQLRHLTWQTKCVSMGDYNQQVDFMGEFSEAFNDMTKRLKFREEQLTAQRDSMLRVFDTMDPIFIIFQKTKEVAYANQMATNHFGILGGDKIGKHASFINALEKELLQAENEQIIFENSPYCFEVVKSSLTWTGDKESVVYSFSDVTSHIQNEAALEHLAITDKLTGLLNRQASEKVMESSWNLCMRQRQPLSIVMFDIDHFKRCNDTYGHIHGDACLSEFGSLLQRMIKRKSDAVIRYGGEEFFALLPFTDADAAMKIAESVRIETEMLVITNPLNSEIKSRFTISCGVSTVIPNNDYSIETLLASADSALYSSKESGRNRITFQDIL